MFNLIPAQCRRLACEVIRQAVRDLDDPLECENAVLWMMSDDFAFFADSLELEADRFTRGVLVKQLGRWRKWKDMARTFKLVRHCDVTGVSGTGVVAEGVTFNGGQTVICWMRPPYTISVFPSPDAVICVHGHGGNTKIVWDENPRRKPKNKEANDRINHQPKRRRREDHHGGNPGARAGNARLSNAAN